MNVVVVGAGNGAGAHLRALRDMGAVVTAVVTGHPRRRAAALALFPRARVDCFGSRSEGPGVWLTPHLPRYTISEPIRLMKNTSTAP